MPKTVSANARIGPVEPESLSNREYKGHCFVIMQFGNPFDKYYHDIYQPAINETGLTPLRADDISRTGDIMRDIWKSTKEAKVMLADLTGRNPNVFYELGLAHAIRKPVILIAQSEEDIPFDLRPQRNILYNINFSNWDEILKSKITEYIKNTMDTPLEEVLPAFLDFNEKNKEVLSDSAARRKIKEMLLSGQRTNTIFNEMEKHDVGRNRTQEIIYEIQDELSDTFKQQDPQE